MGTIKVMGTVMTTAMGTAMTDAVSPSALYRLLAFLSPAFPVGAFTFSHGLEQAIEDGAVINADGLNTWLKDILCFGAGRNDAILLKETWLAAAGGDRKTCEDLRELALAQQPSRERHLESSQQGTAFMQAVQNSWQPEMDTPAALLFRDLSKTGGDPWPYPVALGLTCAAHALPLEASVNAYLHAFAANLISAAVRAVPLGQSDGQSVLAGLEPVIFDISASALQSGLDDLGSSALLADIASMAHETQYSRLFRS